MSQKTPQKTVMCDASELAALEPLFEAHLRDPAFVESLAITPSGRSPFQALVHAIAHQQLHGRAAEAILARLKACFPPDQELTPADITASSDETLRACGFSFGKIASLRDIAEKTLAGVVPTAAEAIALPDNALIDRLVSIRGVGRWTVEMLLIFTLGRKDILPVDDFGVRQGWKLLTQSDEQLKPKALAAIGAKWAPHRTLAARLLWRLADQLKEKAPVR